MRLYENFNFNLVSTPGYPYGSRLGTEIYIDVDWDPYWRWTGYQIGSSLKTDSVRQSQSGYAEGST